MRPKKPTRLTWISVGERGLVAAFSYLRKPVVMVVRQLWLCTTLSSREPISW